MKSTSTYWNPINPLNLAIWQEVEGVQDLSNTQKNQAAQRAKTI